VAFEEVRTANQDLDAGMLKTESVLLKRAGVCSKSPAVQSRTAPGATLYWGKVKSTLLRPRMLQVYVSEKLMTEVRSRYARSILSLLNQCIRLIIPLRKL